MQQNAQHIMSQTCDSEHSSSNTIANKLRIGRLCVVQSIYAMRLKQDNTFSLLLPLGFDAQQLPLNNTALKFTRNLLKNLQTHHHTFEKLFQQHIVTPRPWFSLEIIIQSLLMSAAAELYLKKTPTPVVINEHLELAHIFYNDQAHTLLHGLLARIQSLEIFCAQKK